MSFFSAVFWVPRKIGKQLTRDAISVAQTAKTVVGVDRLRKDAAIFRASVREMDPRKIKSRPRRVETFEAGCRRLGVEEGDLRAAYARQLKIFAIGSCGLLLGLGVITADIALGKWGIILPGIGYLAICGALAFKGSFRCAQIAERELFDARKWARNPDYWLPVALSLPPQGPNR